MNLREAILEQHSQSHSRAIAQWIGNEPTRIKELINIFLHDEYRVVQRSAWLVSEVATLQPESMNLYVPVLIEKLKDKTAHIAVKRNVYRVLQFLELPEAVHGDLMNNCFDALMDPKEALAVRAFAMSILARMTKDYPEIAHELKLIIEDTLQHEPAPSFKSRAKKVLKQLGR
jgi:hypothetical protein